MSLCGVIGAQTVANLLRGSAPVDATTEVDDLARELAHGSRDEVVRGKSSAGQLEFQRTAFECILASLQGCLDNPDDGVGSFTRAVGELRCLNRRRINGLIVQQRNIRTSPRSAPRGSSFASMSSLSQGATEGIPALWDSDTVF